MPLCIPHSLVEAFGAHHLRQPGSAGKAALAVHSGYNRDVAYTDSVTER